MFTAPITRTLSEGGFRSLMRARAPKIRVAERVAPQVQLLVLSRNPELVDVVRTAANNTAHVVQARDLDDAAHSLAHIDPGVLLLDGAITPDVTLSVAQIARRFPATVMVVVGTREEGNELMQLAAAGRIFRFLLMPLSFGPVRLALAAAAHQHVERQAAGRRPAKLPAKPERAQRRQLLAYGALTAALLITFGGLWRVSTLLAAKSALAPAMVSAPAAQSPTMNEPSAQPQRIQVATQLQRATEAMAQGHYLEPAGSSALELYRGVLQIDPHSAAAHAGIRALADAFMLRAEQALLAENLEDAQRILTLVRSIDAAHPRLDFLDSRLARERELRNLSQRRDLGERVRKLVALARSELLAGNLIGTGEDGAVAALLAARKLDPGEPAVKRSVLELSTTLADAARTAMHAGDAPRARAFMSAARELGAGPQLLAAIERSLQEPKRIVAQPEAAIPVPPAPIASAPASESSAGAPLASIIPEPVSKPTTTDEVLQAADLPRLKQVMPAYPSQAAMQGVEGYVDLEFTIGVDGAPRNLSVMSAVPRRIFDRAAMASVRQWRFEPIKQGGESVSRRAALRVRFQLR